MSAVIGARRIAVEDVIEQARPGRGREVLGAKADEPAGRYPKLHAHTAAAVVHHFRHRAFAAARHRDDDPLIVFLHVDDEIFDRLHALAVHLFRDDLRPRHLQLVSFAPHHLDQD